MPEVIPPDIDPMKTNPVIPELRCQSHKCAACGKELEPARFGWFNLFLLAGTVTALIGANYLTK